jgi:hypothetical protein
MSGLVGRGRRHRIDGMKALSWITTIILAGILPLNGWARLGETPEQCEERYGSPSITKKEPEGFLPGVTLAVYQKAGLAISVIFYKGTAGFVFFEKSEKNALGNAKELSLPEIEALLKANGGGKKWRVALPTIRGPLGNAWELDDGSATAEYVDGPNRLAVQTAEYLAAERARRRAKDEENLNGF